MIEIYWKYYNTTSEYPGGGGVQVVCDHQSKFYQILDNIWLKSPETEIVDIA